MKPFKGSVRYYNQTGNPDVDYEEFIWAKDEDVALFILEREHQNANSHNIIPFLTL